MYSVPKSRTFVGLDEPKLRQRLQHCKSIAAFVVLSGQPGRPRHHEGGKRRQIDCAPAEVLLGAGELDCAPSLFGCDITQ